MYIEPFVFLQPLAPRYCGGQHTPDLLYNWYTSNQSYMKLTPMLLGGFIVQNGVRWDPIERRHQEYSIHMPQFANTVDTFFPCMLAFLKETSAGVPIKGVAVHTCVSLRLDTAGSSSNIEGMHIWHDWKDVTNQVPISAGPWASSSCWYHAHEHLHGQDNNNYLLQHTLYLTQGLHDPPDPQHYSFNHNLLRDEY